MRNVFVHFHVKSLRWGKPGFSRIIEKDGKIIETWTIDYFDGIQPFKMSTSIGEIAFNLRTLHICIIGGLNPLNGKFEDTRTKAQYKSLTVLLKNILVLHPAIQIAGYNQFSNSMCPYFSVPDYLKAEGFEEKNIYPQDPFHSINLFSSFELKTN